MNYDELKQSVIEYLTRIGFTQESEDVFTKTNVQHHQIVINGQPSTQVENQIVKFLILGDGTIDNCTSIGLSLLINEHNVSDFWVTSIDDFNFLINNIH